MEGEKELSVQQEQFCQYYVLFNNGAKAARSAGYSDQTAKEMAYELLTRPHIQKRVAELRKAQQGEFNQMKEQMIQELSRIAYGTLVPLYDENGNLLPVKEWDDDSAAIVSSIESEELFEGTGKDRTFIGYKKKVKQWDKLKAHDQLAKILGFYAPEKIAPTDLDGNAILPVFNINVVQPKSE